jgi:hypothetical protein
MDTISPIISLTDDHDLRPIMLFRDWDVDENARTVFHSPSNLLFLIYYDPPEDGERVRPSAIAARVAHVCDGHQLPAMETLERIGKDAIHAFILSLPDDDIPTRGAALDRAVRNRRKAKAQQSPKGVE